MKRFAHDSISIAVAAVTAAGCMTTDDGGGGDTASVEMDVTTVPTGVQCVKIVVNVANKTITPPLVAVTAGSSSASLPIGQLPAGSAVFNGNAYDVACASVTTATVPSWIADPATATLAPGVATTVSMTFRQNNGVIVSGGFAPNVVEVSVGTQATYARLSDGTVLQWGGVDGNQQLLTPTPVPSLTNVAQVAAGWFGACARRTDHTLWCWGANVTGNLGPNIPVGATSTTPAQVPATPNLGPFVGVSMGLQHTCALQGSYLTCWGANASGQLVDGDTTPSTTPMVSFNGIGAVSAGSSHTCALDEQGDVWCGGADGEGQLGNGVTTLSPNPNLLIVSKLENVVQVASGAEHTCVLMGDSTVRCWGDNTWGELGDGTFTLRSSPVTVTGLTNVAQIVTGSTHTCALLGDGTVRCWGQAAMLGAGVISDQSTSIVVPGLTGVTAIHTVGTAQHTCAELSDHTVRCWGNNANGQIGNGTQVFANRPTVVQF